MVSFMDFMLPKDTGLTPEQLDYVDRQGLFNAAAQLANMSAPQVGGVKATPLQLITNGLNAYHQGSQGGIDQFYKSQIDQGNVAAANLSAAADTQNLEWLKNTAPSLNEFYQTPQNSEPSNPKFAQHLYKLAEMQMRTNRPGAEALIRVASMYDPKLARINSQNSPAAIQLADDLANARKRGDTQRVRDLTAIMKIYDKGVIPDENGGVTPIDNYAESVGTIAGVKKKREKQAETDVTTAADIDKQLQDIQQFSASVGRFNEALSKTSMTGPVAGRYGDVTANPGRTDLVSAQNELTLRAKSLLGMPSANFSDADRDFISAIAGGKFGSKEGLSRVASRLESMAQQQAQTLLRRKASIGGAAPAARGGWSVKRVE